MAKLNWNVPKDKTAICMEQVRRFDGMVRYPSSPSAIADLAEALETAHSHEQAIACITGLKETTDELSPCPTSSTIRKTLYDAQNAKREALAKCIACDGTGAVIIPMLVTYRGNGFLIADRERMPGLTDTDVAAMTAGIMRAKEEGTTGPDQMILSVAEPCACRKFGRPIVRGSDACSRCQGHGIYGGHIGGKYDGPWKWCDCEAARHRQGLEPSLIDEANVARNKLLKLNAKRLPFPNAQRAAVRQILEAISGDRQ